MSQRTLHILNLSYKTRGLNNRLLHDGLAASLHNTKEITALGDAVEASKGEQSGESANDVTMNPKLAKQVPRETLASSVEPVQVKVVVMPDPNASMWSTCKENRKTNHAGKKLKMKFKKLKDNIRQYYVDRLEGNQILFTEIEEPFKIGKIDKKDRTSKFRDLREDEFESFAEEVHPLTMRLAVREQRLNVNDRKKEDLEENDYVTSAGVQPKGGYKNYNRLAYSSKNVKDGVNHAFTSDKIIARPQCEDTVKNDRLFIEHNRAATSNGQLRSKVRRDIEANDKGNGGLSDVRGVAPTIYFKVPWLGINSDFILDTISNKNSFSPFEVSSRFISTTHVVRNTITENDEDCEPDEKLRRLPKIEKKKGCCSKITLCGCEPPHPRVNLDNCGRNMHVPTFPFVKRPDYICPSFSECRRIAETQVKRPSECCWFKYVEKSMGPKKPFVTAIERQEVALGQKYWTNQSKLFYHTSARRMGEECGKGSGMLPCHKPAGPGKEKEKSKLACGAESCPKICMPCCEKARIPPVCEPIVEKVACKKVDNPRPSFSECKKNFTMKHVMCECEVPVKPKCPEKKIKEATC